MKRKQLWSAALAAGLMCAAAMPAWAVNIEIDSSKAVIDTADILSSETEDYVTNLSIELGNACGAQIGVYTVDYTGNTDIATYCTEVANAWRIGDADEDNGIVLLLVPGDDNYYAVQGAGLERTLSSSTMGDILEEYLEPYWVEQDYDTGTQEAVKALADRVCEIYNVSLEETAGQQQSGNDAGEVVLIVGIILFILAIILIAALSGGHRHDPPPPGGRGFFFGGPYHGHRPPPPGGFDGGHPGGGFGGGHPGGGMGGRPSGGGHSGGSFHSGGGSFRGSGAGRR